ncbi:cobalt-precorrin 5A hydrolase [Garciella nitratireducens]|uniref:Cobalt-precorrin 5A acetaldehyde-lyase n=1 Tax=Garciella nitratireducens DSM 15102 TaxID=1121911 RepID=A0A1T4KIM8_9FIRM|nr:cobalt-precorrin 5A hydrolase [Garciella nitratireducens]SJZ42260.1 cobalt-precorrin 5A acetaldehyde-lyase [Garciella nitratireducens DSM 15102]
MKLAILTLTKGGYKTAQRVKKYMDVPVKIYTKDSFSGTLKNLVGELFQRYEYLLFIMATGIVVRVISPYLKDKTTDPGVMVMDEKGRFVISLLSGHLGGANAYTQKIAKSIGATPVITTASDVLDLISVDLLAKQLHCEIESLQKAKEVTADIVNKKRVGILSDISVDIPEKENIQIIKSKEIQDCDSVIYITHKIISDPFPRSVQLIPQNILVGIGCKRGTESKKMIQQLYEVFQDLEIHIKSLKKISSIDLKQDEKGILELGEYFKIPVEFIERRKIKRIENLFESSEFVKKSIGIGAVAEPCGYLISHGGKCLMKKRKKSGITLSIWKEK